MRPSYTNSPDGTRVAYDCCGTGPALVLVHGGGTDHQDWHKTGYVKRLQEEFTVITLDLRGHGESDLPTSPEAYTTEKMGQDILAAVDACGVDRFTLWAMSFGGKISRYLAVQSERVVKYIMMATPLGPGVAGERREEAERFCAHWTPIVKACNEGTLEITSLPQDDQEMFKRLNIPAMTGWVRAMLDWPAIEPADFRCPTLWLLGSEDSHAIITYEQYEEALKGSMVQVHIVDGLDHDQVFDEIDTTFPIMLAFTRV